MANVGDSDDFSTYTPAPSFDPEVVVCSRGKFGPGQTYDTELKIYGKHYVLSTGHKNRDDAKAEGNAHIETLESQLLMVCKTFIGDLKEAKP